MVVEKEDVHDWEIPKLLNIGTQTRLEDIPFEVELALWLYQNYTSRTRSSFSFLLLELHSPLFPILWPFPTPN